MVQAWYMDDVKEDQRHPHKKDPNEEVSLDDLKKLGVLYFNIKVDTGSKELEELKKERGYSYEDTITCSPDKLPNYEAKLKSFFEEHIHTDEEIRYILDGSGYFDVRDTNDKWIRIEVVKDDLLILPAGIYHRFTLDQKNYIMANRLFVGEPVWTPHNRSVADSDEKASKVRSEYVRNFVEAES